MKYLRIIAFMMLILLLFLITTAFSEKNILLGVSFLDLRNFIFKIKYIIGVYFFILLLLEVVYLIKNKILFFIMLPTACIVVFLYVFYNILTP